MNRRPRIIAEFIDEYEERQVVHKDARGAIRIMRNREIPALEVSKAIGRLAGGRIRAERIRQHLSLRELAVRAGLTPSKQRMREIESSSRYGMRIGTLYCLAHALGKQPWDFLPEMSEALKEAGVGPRKEKTLDVVAVG